MYKRNIKLMRILFIIFFLLNVDLLWSEVLYRELYSGPSQHPADMDWYVNRVPMGEASSESVVGTAAGGDSISIGGAVNSNPNSPDDDRAYMYLSGYTFLFWTDEYTINRSTWTDLKISWSYNLDGDLVNPMRVAIKIGNQWFVTDPPRNLSGCCWAPNYRATVDLAEAYWRKLHFEEDIILELDEGIPSIPLGDITAFGVFMDFSPENKRIDTFTVEGERIGAQLLIQTIPEEINSVHPGPAIYNYSSGHVVNLKAWDYLSCPDVYLFDHWIGDVVDSVSSQTTIIMDGNKIVTAVFEAARQCGDVCHPYLLGDINQDCRVNMIDFSIFASEWMVAVE